MRRDRAHGNARAMTVVEPLIRCGFAAPNAAGAHRQLSRKVRLGARCERGDLLVRHVTQPILLTSLRRSPWAADYISRLTPTLQLGNATGIAGGAATQRRT